MAKKLTFDEFLKRAREIHGEKYKYDESTYKNVSTKMRIICPIHGEFWQTPSSHVNERNGCKKCGTEESRKKRKTGTEEFVRRAREVHGDKYDYSKVEYVSDKKEVCIICPIHGEFWQTPSKHIHRQHGCPICGLTKRWNDRKNRTTEEFIVNAKKVHGEKYDYSKTVYEYCKKKVTITCLEHGDFKQTPNKHLLGQGCPICSERINSSEGRLFRLLRDRYGEENVEYQYHDSSIFGRKSLDIFFPKQNIAVEYQGIQHFKPIDLFGGEKEYKERRSLDEQKHRECEEHGIRLFYFTFEKKGVPTDYLDKVYTDFDELCEEIDKEM